MSTEVQGKVPPRDKPITNPIDQIKLFNRFANDMFGLMDDGYGKYGDVWAIQVGEIVHVMVRHPDHMQQILLTDAAKYHKENDYKDRKRGLARFMGNGLVTSDGDFWKRQRKLMQPTFHAKRIEAFAETMTHFITREVDQWRDGAVIDVQHAMHDVTLRIIARSAFNLDVNGEDGPRIFAAMEAMQDLTNTPSLLPTWVPTPLELRARKGTRDMHDLIARLIAERRAEGGDHGDVLSMLIEAQDDEGAGMSDEQMHDELVTLFFAGHETTANTLNWTLMALAQNPAVEAKLHEEVDRVLGGRTPTLADLRQLQYTEMVVKESMRLYPAVYAIARTAIEDTMIGEYVIPKGTSVNLNIRLLQRDPRWWGEDAEVFDPERFSPEREKTIRKYAYLPFSTGPRVCIGNSFAMMEAQLLLASIAQRYRLRLPADRQTVEPITRVTMGPKGGLQMIAHAREARTPTPASDAERSAHAVHEDVLAMG
jgi:cytochrome P450